MRRIATSGLVALVILLGGAGQAAAASAPTAAAVRALTTPAVVQHEAADPLFSFSIGSKVSCGSPKACLAVGSNISSSDISTPTAEAWKGAAWKSIAARLPKGADSAELTGVSCKSATSCLAVGDYGTAAGIQLPYALTWNGTSLTPTAALPTPKNTGPVSMGGVSCVTARSCVAFGTSLGSPILVVVETWNGAKWKLRTAGSPGGATAMAVPTAISCFSVTSCVVAGTSFSATASAEKMLLAAWNGKALAVMKAAAPTGASVFLLNDVSCTSVKRCVAAGFGSNSAGTSAFGFAEGLNGTSWTTDKVTWPKGDAESVVLGVSCLTPTRCLAVGEAGTSNVSDAKALSYNGKTWSQLSVPGPGKGKSSTLTGVSCPKANDCVAIGEIRPASGMTSAPLAGLWNGETWKLGGA